MFDFLLLSFILNYGLFRRLIFKLKLFFNIRLDDEFVYFTLHLEQVVEVLELIVEFFIVS